MMISPLKRPPDDRADEQGTNESQGADLSPETEVCPVCGGPYNHVIDNGYRNYYPKDVPIEICTDDQERIFVHTNDLLVESSLPDLADGSETDTEAD